MIFCQSCCKLQLLQDCQQGKPPKTMDRQSCRTGCQQGKPPKTMDRQSCRTGCQQGKNFYPPKLRTVSPVGQVASKVKKNYGILSQYLWLGNRRFSISVASIRVKARSKELTRGPPRVSSALSFIGGSTHRRKSAACPKFDLVWLNLSPIPVGRRRVSSFK